MFFNDIPCKEAQAVCHGMETVEPKYGVTHKQVLRATGVNVGQTPAKAAAQLDRAGTY